MSNFAYSEYDIIEKSEILYVIDKTVDDAGARFKLYPRAIKYVEKQYTERIAATLKKKGYEDDIDSVVTYCIERTKVFNK